MPIFQQALAAYQVATEELMKEVGNSVVEFKRSKQEYDEDRVQEQVSITTYKNFSVSLWFPHRSIS